MVKQFFDKEKLHKHIKRLCIKNLRSKKVKCCAECAFEEIICKEFSELKGLFIAKRNMRFLVFLGQSLG